jgi:hypothetical protein
MAGTALDAAPAVPDYAEFITGPAPKAGPGGPKQATIRETRKVAE